MHRIVDWWENLELWVVSLSFVPQVALVLLVTLPFAGCIAWALDKAFDGLVVLGRSMCAWENTRTVFMKEREFHKVAYEKTPHGKIQQKHKMGESYMPKSRVTFAFFALLVLVLVVGIIAL